MKIKILVFFLVSFSVLCAYSEGLEYEYGGEVRTRFAYENNPDLDYDTSDGSVAADFRALFNFKLKTSVPLYFYINLELGNIALNEELFTTDNFLENIELETKDLYVGFDFWMFDIKTGLIVTESPSNIVIDEDNAGIKVKANFDVAKIKAFYSLSNLVDGYFNFIENEEGLNQLFFLGAETDNYLNSNFNVWGMVLDGNDHDSFSYIPFWTGIEFKNENSLFNIENRFIYNGGWVSLNSNDFTFPISALYTNMKISIEPIKDSIVFSRFNLTSSFESETAMVNQFQVINGNGNLDTGLGLLFGGSSYGSESYFDNNSVSLVEDNLSSGDIVLDDPGLFIYELGISKKFVPFPITSDLIWGGANTAALFSGDGYFSSLLGLEIDLHNKFKITDAFTVSLSFCLLFPGNAFEENYLRNNSEFIIGWDTSFKTDFKLCYSY